jgi:O-antigen ligase
LQGGEMTGKQLFFAIAATALSGTVLVVLWQYYPIIVLFALFFFCIFLFSTHPNIGLYILVFLGLFHAWQIDLSVYESTRHVPFLSGINAPVVDFFAIVLLFSLFVNFIVKVRSFGFFDKLKKIKLGIILYGLFLLVAFVSVFFSYNNFIEIGAKNFIRPIFFVFIAYFLAPVLFLHSAKDMQNIFKIWFGAGALIALFGLSSLFVLDHTGWFRVVPYGIKGFAPFGYNHNQIAEVLVILLPAGVLLFAKARQENKFFILLGNILIALCAVLTLSRAAWIVLFLQALIFAFFYKEQAVAYFKKYKILLAGIVLLIAPIIIYMALFLGSSVVDSSNFARVESTKAAVFYATQSPFFGYGPGMFVPLLNETQIYTMDFGEPLDAHGFIQKIIVEQGFLGLILFSAFLLWILFYLYKFAENPMHKQTGIALFAMCAGAVVFQLFNTSYWNSVMWLPLGIAVAGTFTIDLD